MFPLTVRSTSMYVLAESVVPTEQEFEDIYRSHYRRVLGLCRCLLNSPEAAEDAAHEVFLRARRKFPTYKADRPVSSWLLGIAGNHCIDLLRRITREKRLFDPDSAFEAPSPAPGPLGQVLAAERGKDVRGALGRLPDKYRVPLVLAYYNELGYGEIAAALGIERAHVATLIFRGKQLLRQRLEEGETT